MKTWKAVAISVAASLIVGVVSGWVSSEKTVATLLVEVQWIKATITDHAQRIAALERR